MIISENLLFYITKKNIYENSFYIFGIPLYIWGYEYGMLDFRVLFILFYLL